MGTHKKEANRKVREGKTGDGMGNVRILHFFLRCAVFGRSVEQAGCMLHDP